MSFPANSFLIPLQGVPQVFRISMAGVPYLLTLKFNDSPDAGWEMDIADGVTNLSVAAGLPLVTGASVLEQLEYLGINGEVVVFTDGDETAVPSFTNLGTESNLYFATDVVDNG